MSMFTKLFWIATADRAIRTGAQAVLIALGFGVGQGAVSDSAESQVINAFLLDWGTLGGFFLGGMVLAVLFSLVASNVGPTKSPSFTRAEVVPVASEIAKVDPVPNPPGEDRVPGPDHRADG